MMKLGRSVSFSLALSLFAATSVSVIACGGSVEHAPQTSASALTKAPIGAGTHGMVKVVGDALGEVPLRPEQRTEFEKLAADAEARHAPLAEHHKELMLAFADHVEKGAVDRAALQPKLDQGTAELDKIGAEDRGALVKLHALLDPDQRNAFVDALERQMKASHGGERAHGPHAKGRAMGPGGFMMLKELSEELKLTDAQRSQIHDLMRDSFKEGFKARMHHDGSDGERGERGGHGGKRAFEAFRGDKLDLDKVAPPHAAKAMATSGAAHIIALAEKVLPILTPEQRKIAADKIRASAAAGGPLVGH